MRYRVLRLARRMMFARGATETRTEMPLYMGHPAVAITLLMVIVMSALVLRIKRLTAAPRVAERNYAAAQARLRRSVIESDTLEHELREALAAQTSHGRLPAIIVEERAAGGGLTTAKKLAIRVIGGMHGD